MPRRPALTLVEMLVSAALTIFIMALLTEMFVTGLEAFRRLGAIAEMDQQLRIGVSQLRKDLQADHFDGSKRLSRLADSGKFQSPELGYFQYGEGGTVLLPSLQTAGLPSFPEGVDSQGLPSTLDDNDYLAFTVHLHGNRAEDFFFGQVPLGSPLDTIGQPESRWDSRKPNGVYTSQWAEVSYLLSTSATGSTGTRNLYNLYRVQHLLVPEFFTTPSALVPAPQLATDATGAPIPVSDTGSRHYYYSLYDVAAYGVPNAARVELAAFHSPSTIRNVAYWRFAADSWSGGKPRYNSIPLQPWEKWLLLTNVVSFDVKVWDPTVNDFVDLGGTVGRQFGPPGGLYDTGGRVSPQTADAPSLVPHPYPIKALQITIRVWEPRTKQTRQVTIIQDM